MPKNATIVFLCLITLCLTGCASGIAIPDSVKADSGDFAREVETASKTHTFGNCSHLNNRIFDVSVTSKIANDKRILSAIDRTSLNSLDPKLSVKKFELSGGIVGFAKERLIWHLTQRCGAKLDSGTSAEPLVVEILDAFTEVEGSDKKVDVNNKPERELDDPKVDRTRLLTVTARTNNISYLDAKVSFVGSKVPDRSRRVNTRNMDKEFTYKNAAKNGFKSKIETHGGLFQSVVTLDDEIETLVGGDLIASLIESVRTVTTNYLYVEIPKTEGTLGLVTIKNGEATRTTITDSDDVSSINRAIAQSVGSFGSARNRTDGQNLKDPIDTIEMYTGIVGYVGIGNLAYLTHHFIDKLIVALKD